ncbi:MAG: hypothetical protein RLZZ196_2621 [Bacteroidota bacterium]|jgi:mannitol-specific phosphotransferase system IIBC component
MTEDQLPKLSEASFIFTQDSNCMNREDVEEIEIKCRADIGIDAMGSCFYEIKTECWSVDNLDELKMLIDRIEKSLFPNGRKKNKK